MLDVKAVDCAAPIRAFVLENFPICRQKDLQDSDSLIESGIIDSMGMLELVAFVESDFGIVVAETDLIPENFESIATLSAFVEAKQDQ
jgi:acyl carrier protein